MNVSRYLRTEPYLRRAAALAGRRYAVGLNLADAEKLAARLGSRGYASSIAYWNRPGESPDLIVHENQQALGRIKASSDYLSVKAPSFEASLEHAMPIIEKAASEGVGVHFDSHGVEYTDDLLRIVELASARSVDTGLSVPGRWRRSAKDLEILGDWGVVPRLIKGQWADPGDPGLDPYAGFLRMVDIASETAQRVRLATHDATLLEASIERLSARGVAVEVEILYALPTAHILQIAGRYELPVRVYLPYGIGFVPYAIGKLTGNPALALRLLRDIITPSSATRFPSLLKTTS